MCVKVADIKGMPLGSFLTMWHLFSIIFSFGSLSVIWKMNLVVEQSQVGMLSFKASSKLGQPDSSDP